MVDAKQTLLETIHAKMMTIIYEKIGHDMDHIDLPTLQKDAMFWARFVLNECYDHFSQDWMPGLKVPDHGGYYLCRITHVEADMFPYTMVNFKNGKWDIDPKYEVESWKKVRAPRRQTAPLN